LNRIPFDRTAFANLIFLPVRLGGFPATALFDTGASVSFLSRSAAAAAGVLPLADSARAGNNNGAVLSFQKGRLRALSLGTLTLHDLTVGILEDGALDFNPDEKGRRFPASMLLGWDVISQLCWSFDEASRLLSIGPGGAMPKNSTLTWNRFPILSVRYGQELLPMGLDSGHTETLLDSSWLSRLPKARPSSDTFCGVGACGEEAVHIAPELRFSIGKSSFRLFDLDILSHEIYGAEKGSLCGLLGADLLAGCSWKLDYPSGFFELEKLSFSNGC